MNTNLECVCIKTFSCVSCLGLKTTLLLGVPVSLTGESTLSLSDQGSGGYYPAYLAAGTYTVTVSLTKLTAAKVLVTCTSTSMFDGWGAVVLVGRTGHTRGRRRLVRPVEKNLNLTIIGRQLLVRPEH